MRDKLVWVIVTFAIGGISMIASVEEGFALPLGIAMLVVAAIIGGIAWKRRGREQTQLMKKRVLVKDTRVRAKAKRTKDVTAMEVEGDTELSNVRVDLEAQDVNRATALKIKGSLNIINTPCSKCGRQFSKVYTGKRLSEIECPHCGHINKVGKGE